ncbi:MAG: hypothetical protein V9E98_07035 [Candidatus Nanopelagicales bacterium]
MASCRWLSAAPEDVERVLHQQVLDGDVGVVQLHQGCDPGNSCGAEGLRLRDRLGQDVRALPILGLVASGDVA